MCDGTGVEKQGEKMGVFDLNVVLTEILLGLQVLVRISKYYSQISTLWHWFILFLSAPRTGAVKLGPYFII